MLTRIHICGFKNLVDLKADFGPLTGIAGLNGVGKSNLFDALRFLQGLATGTFLEAAGAIRGGEEDLMNLCSYHREGPLTFDLDLLIPRFGTDDFGQPAQAGATFLNYRLELALEREPNPLIRLVSERLAQIRKSEARKRLRFASNDWVQSAVLTSARNAPFISTSDDQQTVYRHQDQGNKQGGNKWQFPVKTLTRTILSSAQTAQESPTLLLAKKAFQNLRFLQLEPGALRRPDWMHAENQLGSDGGHLPATVNHLAGDHPETLLTVLANRLAGLVSGVSQIRVVRDEARKTLALHLEDLHGQVFPASCLSDGTLRFLALAVLENDSRVSGTLCLEEPENGIHPEKVEAMLYLLRNIACSPVLPLNDEDNPLRQVLFSTHSPVLVKQLSSDQLLFAAGETETDGAASAKMTTTTPGGLQLLPLSLTWRGQPSVDRGKVISYLEGSSLRPESRASVQHWVQLPLFD